jgi:hypothetical protein
MANSVRSGPLAALSRDRASHAASAGGGGDPLDRNQPSLPKELLILNGLLLQ